MNQKKTELNITQVKKAIILLLIGGLMACASKKQTSSTSKITVFKTAIKNLEKTESPEYDNWAEYGIRSTGQNLATLISLKQLNEILPCPLYKSGPHTTENWDFYNEKTFGHYNPEAIAYLGDVTNELLTDKQFVKTTRPLINKYLRKQMRILLGIYQCMDTMSHKEELLTYMVLPAEEQRKLWTSEGSIGEEMAEPYYVYQWENYSADVEKGARDCRFVYFWARRHKDGTDKQIYHILEKIYATYFEVSNISKEQKQ